VRAGWDGVGEKGQEKVKGDRYRYGESQVWVFRKISTVRGDTVETQLPHRIIQNGLSPMHNNRQYKAG
jgi:hypothetical protein